LTKRIPFHLDWLRVRTDTELLEYKEVVDNLIAELRSIVSKCNTADLPPEIFPTVQCTCEYLRRTAGPQAALEFLEDLDRLHQHELFTLIRLKFLAQHQLHDELRVCLGDLNAMGIDSPAVRLFLLQYSLSLGHRQQAESDLAYMINNFGESGQMIRAITVATVFGLEYDRLHFASQVRWGRRFLAMDESIRNHDKSGSLPVAHCINMDRASERMSRCTELYRDRAELRRIPGIPGDALPADRLRGTKINPRLPKSAIGCSLSHISAWERIAANDDTAHAQFVVEDDGLPIWLDGSTFAAVDSLMERNELDLLFVHDRGSPLEFALQEFNSSWQPAALPFHSGLERFPRHKRNLPPGWGADGYCISVRGARKLLALVERDGLTNHLDWQLFLYSAEKWDHAILRSKQNVAANYRQTCGRPPHRELDSAILNFPLVAHIDLTGSTR